MKKASVSLVLACYNEGPTFEQNVGLILKELKKLKRSWEIVFVEDHSTDDTLAKVEKLQKQIKNSFLVVHKKNLGRGKTVADGILKCHGEICGYMDVDCEISPTYLPIFIQEIENGQDMVVGNRFYENHPTAILRVIASRLYAVLVSMIIRLPISDTEAGFKFFKKNRILPVINETQDRGWFWDTEICTRAFSAGLKVSQVPVLFVRRGDKKSTVRLIPDSIEYLKRLILFKLSMTK